MAEQLDLTVPIATPSRTTYSVTKVTFDWGEAVISIDLIGSDGKRITCFYDGATATTLMVQLNKVNLSTSSLQRRILERLVTDGKLPAGSVSGAPA